MEDSKFSSHLKLNEDLRFCQWSTPTIDMFDVFSLGYPLNLGLLEGSEFFQVPRPIPVIFPSPTANTRNFSKSLSPCIEELKYVENMKDCVKNMKKYVGDMKK